jgi:hypothetical protein
MTATVPADTSAHAARRAVFTMVQDLQVLNDTLARSPIAGRYWLFGGLVLGWARERAVLGHDAVDADFAFFAEDEPLLQASFEHLYAAGFSPLYRFPGAGRPTTEYSFRKDHRKFEFFRINVVGDRFHFHNYGVGPTGPVTNVCALPAQPLEEIRFLERTWLKVRDHDAELTANYGDWRTPDPDWNYLESPSIVETTRWENPRALHWNGEL